MGTPEKRTPQLPVTHNLDVRFANKNSKSLLIKTLNYNTPPLSCCGQINTDEICP